MKISKALESLLALPPPFPTPSIAYDSEQGLAPVWGGALFSWYSFCHGN